MSDSSDGACIAFPAEATTGPDCVSAWDLHCLLQWPSICLFLLLDKAAEFLAQYHDCLSLIVVMQFLLEKTKVPPPSHISTVNRTTLVSLGEAIRWIYTDHSVSVCAKTWMGKLHFILCCAVSASQYNFFCHTLIHNLNQLLNVAHWETVFMMSPCCCK